MSPVLRSTEHEVWKLMDFPLITTLLLAGNEPLTVKVWPSVTVACELPLKLIDALAGKVLVRAPYALVPWLLLLLPCPAVYKKVSDVGRFLLLLLQTKHD